MRKYTVIWFYVANYGKVTVEAVSAGAAIDSVIAGYSKDFKERARIYAFEGEPDAVYEGLKAKAS